MATGTSGDRRDRGEPRRSVSLRTLSAILCIVWLFGPNIISSAHANGMQTAWEAYSRGNYVRAVAILSPLALRGSARAQALLGFLYENGFGVPQSYDAAADLYQRAATQGDPSAQSRLGLLYDKGHGVPQNDILAYKWLDLAAAHAMKREREYYARLRNAIASKMSSDQILVGQHLALVWTPGRW